MTAVEKAGKGLWRPAYEVGLDVLEEAELVSKFPDAFGLRTGIKVLDDHIKVALEPGRLAVVAGQTGGAKTALLVQLAVAFSAQRPVLLITLEDEVRDVLRRALASMSRESVGHIRAGFPGGEVPDTLTDAVISLRDLGLDVIESENIGRPTVERIAVLVQAWRRQFPADEQCIVIIDQLSHIARSNPRDEFWERYPHLTKPPHMSAEERLVLDWQVNTLREMAGRQNLTVVLAHQLNDNVSDEQRPTRQSIRGSRGIGQAADLVMCPWVPKRVPNPFAGVGDPKWLDNEAGEGEIIGIKARSVPEFTAKVRWVGPQQRFIDPADGEHEPWKPVPKPALAQQEGFRQLLALRQRFQKEAADRLQAGLDAGKQPAGELPGAEPS